MNIKILDSWLKEYVKTAASPEKIAEAVSLTSVGIEHIEKWKNDFLYDIEITTNRPDLASVIGMAREAAAVLPQFGSTADFRPPVIPDGPEKPIAEKEAVTLEIINDPKLVQRICAVVMEVTVKKSPEKIKDRLEASEIRSLNNLIDITNYVMRTIGYPTHVMDYDRIGTGKLIVRESKKGESITTLDGKTYTLPGGDIVADDGTGRIVDLLGVMGLQNSVVTEKTKRIIFFINNDDPHRIRKTSMTLGIRTEAAQLNEKALDPELVMTALRYGIQLYEELADGKRISPIIDIYPEPVKERAVTITESDIETVIGIPFSLKDAAAMLEKLGFKTTIRGNILSAVVPSYRLNDVAIPEDLIEEIARVYGYQNIPNALPPIVQASSQYRGIDPFFWEQRVKQALKYWGFTEVYTYPLVSEAMLRSTPEETVKLKNPLGEEFAYMRRSLIPSLRKVIDENKKHDTIKIFEIANVYEKAGKRLPKQTQQFAGMLKQKNVSFFEVKGILEQLSVDLALNDLTFHSLPQKAADIEIRLGKTPIGTVEIIEDGLIAFEVDFELFTKDASLHKAYTPLSKYPPVVEDISLVIDEKIPTGDIIMTIKNVSTLIAEVQLVDKYESSRTFHLSYRSPHKNLTTEEVKKIREKILHVLKEKFRARVKA